MKATKKNRNKEIVQYIIKVMQTIYRKGTEMYKEYIYKRNEKRFKKYKLVYEVL